MLSKYIRSHEIFSILLLLFDEHFALQTIEIMNFEAFHTLFTLRHMACDFGDAILDFT